MGIPTVVLVSLGLAILAFVVIVWLLARGPSLLEKEREAGKALRQQGSTEAVTRYLELLLRKQFHLPLLVRDLSVTPASIVVTLDATPIKSEAVSRAQQALARSYRYYRRRDVPPHVQPSQRTVNLRYKELLNGTIRALIDVVRQDRDFPQDKAIISVYDDEDCVYSVLCKLDESAWASPLQIRENKPSVYEKHPVVSFHEYVPITLEYIQSLSPRQFEGLVRNLLVCLGYHARLTSASADEGMDIVAEKQGKRVLVECKRYDKPVGVKHLRELYGAVADEDAEAWFITSSTFTEPAMRFAQDKGIRTINAQELLRLLAMRSGRVPRLPHQHFERETRAPVKSQRLAIPVVGKLEKILALEERAGYTNRSVIGGLERLALFWGPEAAKAEEVLPVEEIVALLRRYPGEDEKGRRALVNEVRDLLMT